MGKLFISYRRSETQDITARIHERLALRFGPESIFIDIDSIPLGYDFRQARRDAVDSSNVVLVIIGQQWLTITDDRDVRRLEDPNDFVRIEVEAALIRGIPVVPVLTQGASIPKARDLPTSIAELAYRHGADVRSDQHFGDDVELLIERLVPAMNAPDKPQTSPVNFVSVAPVVPQPSAAYPASVYPAPELAPELAKLGFTGVNVTGIPAITPPLNPVPHGRFLMGSDRQADPNASNDEEPQHWVDVPAFQIARYPVTVAEYALAVQKGAVAKPATIGPLSWEEQLQHPTNPVVCVTWTEAMAYGAWLASVTQQEWRVATEAQWEKAARWDPVSKASRIYPWGNEFDKNRCNSRESALGRTQPVGAHAASNPVFDGRSPCGA